MMHLYYKCIHVDEMAWEPITYRLGGEWEIRLFPNLPFSNVLIANAIKFSP